jgi:hypothetical protein
VTQLATNRFQLNKAGYVTNEWIADPEARTPFEAVLEPHFWAHVSAKLRPTDEIIVRAEDGSYYARLLVQDAARLEAKVAVLEKYDLTAVEVVGADAAPSGYEVKHAGPHAKWRVVRLSDRAPIKDKFETKGQAQQWLVEHLKGLAA